MRTSTTEDEAAWPAVTTPDQLEDLVGRPGERARTKERARLSDIDRAWLAASPFCVLATADADGRCDASPKGDPAGTLVHVVDDATIAIAERPGNRRVDGYRNVLANPHVGLVFVVPGRGDTLRINGRARLVSDAPFFDALAVRGRRPVLAMVVEIETVFFHCSKAFRRAQLWEPGTWDPEQVPPRAVIAHELEPVAGQGLAELEDYYRPANYDKGLY
ncbi:MSMEG_1061 family FMN-dependent PPOX-type flavoprotein [Nocardioides sp. zg-1228]|uniref:MSMEG_1061 family FMN-dependent PPOX-type flavoprotein n=1 Tax=Nocardioides sp. zg-1228 TaxID=2763008 RepID=UPI001642601F|nr:MSMEG_1061 family FMN-dependent PPOX-type flavoprotein [Nocardioides sp. zg-1228]MBC2934536.1 pyridoxamine 5'-phosphate oxidase family protein [Nocardioides sp. zg-1228]QSF59292.1 pyridoxamine 5'-phosphate oxidase family protein [Nocardioides sp. zg-1228]